jgi:hypothetical protein
MQNTITNHTPHVYENWFFASRVDEPVLNYYEVSEHYGGTGPFATLDEALAYAKSQIQAFDYVDHVSHSRSFIHQRRVTTRLEMDAYCRAEIQNAQGGHRFSPLCGEVVNTIEVFLSAEELATLVDKTND